MEKKMENEMETREYIGVIIAVAWKFHVWDLAPGSLRVRFFSPLFGLYLAWPSPARRPFHCSSTRVMSSSTSCTVGLKARGIFRGQGFTLWGLGFRV